MASFACIVGSYGKLTTQNADGIIVDVLKLKQKAIFCLGQFPYG